MASINTSNLYFRIIKLALQNKQAIIDDKNKLLEHFNSLPASSQRTAIAAYRYFKNDLNLNEEDIINLKKHFKTITNKRQFQYMEQSHINAFMTYLTSIANIKQKLILTILFDLGIRRSEVQKVVKAFLEHQKDIFMINSKNHPHKIFLTTSVKSIINEALSQYDENTIINWCNQNNVYRITKDCFRYIGFNGACHDFRRHFAQNLDEKGQRLSVIKTLMGHSNIATTFIYIKQNDSELKQVIENQHKQTQPVCMKDYLSLMTKFEHYYKKIQQQDEFINTLLRELNVLSCKYKEVIKDHKILSNYIKHKISKSSSYVKSNLIKQLINKELQPHVPSCLKRSRLKNEEQK